MKKVLSWVVVLMLGLLAFAQKAEALLSISTTADAYIWDIEESGTLNGVPDDILNTNGLIPGTGILNDGTALDARAITVFNVSPYNMQTILSATLRGYGRRADRALDGPITVDIKSYVGDGAITLEDYNISAIPSGNVTFPAGISGPPYFPDDPASIINPLNYFEVDVTSSLSSLWGLNAEYVEFRWSSQDLSAYIEATDADPIFNYQPYYHGVELGLTFGQASAAVPEPATILLFGIGGAGLALRRRFQKNV